MGLRSINDSIIIIIISRAFSCDNLHHQQH